LGLPEGYYINTKGGDHTNDKISPSKSQLYEINGKRVFIYRFPDWSFTPATLFLLIIVLLVNGLMDYGNLFFGGIASQAQLRSGTFVSSEHRTGPNKNYVLEAQELIRKEVMKRDPRIKQSYEVQIEQQPERYRTFFADADKQNGYLGNGRFRIFYWYFVREAGKSKANYGYGVVKLYQEPVGFMVKQIFSIEDLKITHRE
jgi:hypothetical protein